MHIAICLIYYRNICYSFPDGCAIGIHCSKTVAWFKTFCSISVDDMWGKIAYISYIYVATCNVVKTNNTHTPKQ